MGVHSIDAEDDQFAYRYDTQLLIDRRDRDLDEDEIADYITTAATITPAFHPAGSRAAGIKGRASDTEYYSVTLEMKRGAVASVNDRYLLGGNTCFLLMP